jgi:hypothetical protein
LPFKHWRTPLLGEGVAEADAVPLGFVELVRVDVGAALVDDLRVVGVLPVHVPNAELQPVPQ